MKNTLRALTIFAASLLALSLSACLPIAVGAGATVGVAAAKEGGIKSAVTDKAIYIKISDLWARSQYPLFRKLDLNVREGRVFVGGSVPTPDMRVEAMRLAWQAEGVKQVINEITVDEGGGVSRYAADALISGNVKAALLFDKEVQSINYDVETVNGTVYLMGVAQDRRELDRALSIARNTSYVKNVVSYARLRGENPAGVLAPTEGGSTQPNTMFNKPHGY